MQNMKDKNRALENKFNSLKNNTFDMKMLIQTQNVLLSNLKDFIVSLKISGASCMIDDNVKMSLCENKEEPNFYEWIFFKSKEDEWITITELGIEARAQMYSQVNNAIESIVKFAEDEVNKARNIIKNANG